MAKQDRKLDIRRPGIRPGEGALIDVQFRHFAETGGLSGVAFQADMGSAPVPERKYTAHAYNIVSDIESVKLLFCQKKIGRLGGLRSLLVVNMSPTAAIQFMGTIDAVQSPTFYELADRVHLIAQSPMDFEEEPPQTVELPANLVLCAWSGAEACMDFYQASPFAMSAAQEGKKLALDAVVRVDIRASCFLGLLRHLDKWRKKAPPIMGMVNAS